MTRSKLSVLTILSLLIISMTATNPAMASSTIADSDLPYTYEFAQRFIVAGERVLNLTIANNSSRHIEALEFEARLVDAFGDVISDWSTFSNPDLKIPSGGSGSLTLTLSRKNILGVNIENVLDKARSLELRYTRILLDDGSIVRKDDLYSNLQKIHGQYRIDLEIHNEKLVEDKTNYNFERVNFGSGSRLYKFIEDLPYSNSGQYRNIANLDHLVKLFAKDAIIVLVKATNVSDEIVKKNWETGSSPAIMLLDETMNQYSQYALMYAPQIMSNIPYYGEHLPGVTLTMVYVFDKFDGYNPSQIEVYIDGEKYVEAFKLR